MPANLGPSHDAQEDALQRLAVAFPEAITDGKVDLERLKQALGEHVETGRERYGLTWPGKAEAIKAAQRPSLGTLRPKAGEGINEESTGNLIIEGDNLEVLKLLQKAYLGKIKMIYIDPPYNTGNDFVYEDNFADPLAGYLEQTGQTVDGKRLSTNTETAGRYHSNWLSMMHPRLTLARNLLREDGVIFISIDDNEVANLSQLCSEIFGEENLVNVVALKMSEASGMKMAHADRRLPKMKEYVLMVSRNKSALKLTPITVSKLDEATGNVDQYLKYYNKFIVNPASPVNEWEIISVKEAMTLAGVKSDPASIRQFVISNASRVIYRTNNQLLARLRFDTLTAEVVSPTGIKYVWWEGKQMLFLVDHMSETLGDLWVDISTINLNKEIMDVEGFGQGQKPLALLKRLISLTCDETFSGPQIILDFFAGSGTTAHAVLEMNEEDGGNRKFILVQLPEVVDEDSAAAKAGFANIAEITKERVRRVIKKLDGGTKEGLGLDGTKSLDRGFKVYALDRSNFVPWDATAATDAASLEQQLELAVDNVLHDRSHADLLAEILLKTGFPLDTPITKVTIAGTIVYQVADPGFLVCLADTVDAPLIKAIAATKPHRVVILDAAFQGNDALKTNAVQAFKDQGVEMFRTA
jgi:adenine-specific DNA-methyltransferase